MNYRHAFHAGNHADVLKHVVLLALLESLKRKDTPFFVLDTHAGRGSYALDAEAARKTAEADGGIGRLRGRGDLPQALSRYLAAVDAAGDTLAHPAPAPAAADAQPRIYPGSPLLAARALREQDRLAACELHPEEAQALKALFARDPRVAVHQRDGYTAVKALLPPKVGTTRFARGLVLIDPPYEAQDAEYPLVAAALREGLHRWPNATYAVWYPIKQRRSLLPFFRSVAAMPAGSVLLAELQVRPDDSPLRLNGSGMVLLNPPWQFDRDIAPALTALRTLLGETGATTRLEWLKNAG